MLNQNADSKSTKDNSSKRSDTSSEAGASEKLKRANPAEVPRISSGKDLKMELALEMTKFIEEIEYQLDFVVPMGELCYVCILTMIGSRRLHDSLEMPLLFLTSFMQACFVSHIGSPSFGRLWDLVRQCL